MATIMNGLTHTIVYQIGKSVSSLRGGGWEWRAGALTFSPDVTLEKFGCESTLVNILIADQSSLTAQPFPR